MSRLFVRANWFKSVYLCQSVSLWICLSVSFLCGDCDIFGETS